MPAFSRFSLKPQVFYENILRPVLGDQLPDVGYNTGANGEFTVLDDVSDSTTIVDITPVTNILKRRDASCFTTDDPVAKADAGKISVTELYGKTVHCREKFYQGDLKQWRSGDPQFVNRITGWFKNAIKTDLVTNMYLGDVNRVPVAGQEYSTNLFDGVVTRYQKHVLAGTIPGAQTFTIPNGAITPANAYTYFQNLYSKQPNALRLILPSAKAFYVDRELADAYEDYLIQTNAASSDAANFVQNGITVRAFKGIPIFVNEFLGPVLNQISGADAHFAVLTVRGNFVFATDKDYGEGPNGNQALMVWYSYDELQWKWMAFLKAGTKIAAPELSTLGLPA